jgi:hypothetical protein
MFNSVDIMTGTKRKKGITDKLIFTPNEHKNLIKNSIKTTVKPLYAEHVDNWFLKLILYYFNRYIFKNQLSTCST